MVCIMPLADGQKIPSESLKSLTGQDVEIALMPVTRPRDHFTFPGMPQVFVKKIRTDRKSIGECRNILREIASGFEDKYVLHVDSDVVFSSEHDVSDMIRFLDENPRVAYVGLNTKNAEIKIESVHIPMACLLIRTEILLQVTFHNGKYFRKCNCLMFGQDVRKLPHPDGGFWTSRYLDHRRLKEIHR